MWSGTRSVGKRTMPSGKRPSSMASQGTDPRVPWLRGCRPSRVPAPRRLSRREGVAGRGPDRRRRPLPGDRGEPPLRGLAAARDARSRQRGSRRAAARPHHSRASDQEEGGNEMSELSDRIKDVIAQEPVTLFMKGTPQMVMCGNSDRALRALREAGAPVTAVDVLPDPAIRQELSALSGWPTIPQVFVGGELIGGADIAPELAESGELTQVLETKLGADYRDEAEVRVVDVLTPAQR